MNVVPHPVRTPLTDIAAQMRQLADNLPDGATIAVVLVRDGDGELRAYHWGDHLSRAEIAGTLAEAVHRTVSRTW